MASKFPSSSGSRVDITGAEPFESAEDAWFWFIAAMKAKEDGARVVAGHGMYLRPCEPVDILKTLDRLYRNRQLTMEHFYVLKHYGIRHMAPDPRRPKEARAHSLWEEAMTKLEMALEAKGIVRTIDNFEGCDVVPAFLTKEESLS